ncbi:spore coat protein [Paenibacillus agricola]|uniref:Spore coat protein n=1 Tax=Paenibacillus agricola TaxID=2716264 RepID=A0ABX0J2M8_9BACL|nr:spore coat protein [Paenibacillus agricola]NHN30607.1 spore coat protein [Paenibacillus agricola]
MFNQQQQTQQQQQHMLPEKDMLYTILCELKRTSREYTIAANESNCSNIRQVFNGLLQSTMQMQEEVYQCMKQQNMYNTSSPALRQEMEKQFNQFKREQQETEQFVQARLQRQSVNSQTSVFGYTNTNSNNGNSQYQPYMM